MDNIQLHDRNAGRSKENVGYAGRIQCEVSGRYLLLEDGVSEQGYINAHVWSSNGEQDRKICELVLRYDDILAYIEMIEKNKETHYTEEEEEKYDILDETKKLIPVINNIVGQIDSFRASSGQDDDSFELKERIAQSLRPLSYEQLHIVMSVMYIGREEYINPDSYESKRDYYRDLDRYYMNNSPRDALISMTKYLYTLNQSTSGVIDGMLSKRPLDLYLKQGLDVLRLQRL